MTHANVTRAMLVFTGTLTIAAVAFGCLTNRPPASGPAQASTTASATHPGETLFSSYCTGCHTIDEAVLFVRAAPDVDTARRDLTSLLASHGDSSPDEDTLIVDYVLTKR